MPLLRAAPSAITLVPSAGSTANPPWESPRPPCRLCPCRHRPLELLSCHASHLAAAFDPFTPSPRTRAIFSGLSHASASLAGALSPKEPPSLLIHHRPCAPPSSAIDYQSQQAPKPPEIMDTPQPMPVLAVALMLAEAPPCRAIPQVTDNRRTTMRATLYLHFFSHSHHHLHGHQDPPAMLPSMEPAMPPHPVHVSSACATGHEECPPSHWRALLGSPLPCSRPRHPPPPHAVLPHLPLLPSPCKPRPDLGRPLT